MWGTGVTLINFSKKPPCLHVQLISQFANMQKGLEEKIWQLQKIMISHHQPMQKHQDKEFCHDGWGKNLLIEGT